MTTTFPPNNHLVPDNNAFLVHYGFKMTPITVVLQILTIFSTKNCCNLLAYIAYCHVVMSCLHTVMSVYYLLVDYYVYFVYVCMFATTKW